MTKNKYVDPETDGEYEYLRQSSESKASRHKSRSPSRSRYTDAEVNEEERPEEIIEIKEFDISKMSPTSVEDKHGIKIVVVGKPGCFAKATPVLMYNGSIKHIEDVIVGDIVMGDDHTPRIVQELYHDFDQMYEIITERETSYTVNRLHDLVLLNNTTKEIIEISVEEYLQQTDSWKNEFQCISSTSIQCWINKDETINYFNLGTLIGELYLQTDHCKKLALFSKYKLTHLLNKYNFINHNSIPFEYKTSDYSCRRHLFMGLINSLTNFAESDRSSFLFHFKENDCLIQDIIFLARSIGYIVNYKINNNNVELTVSQLSQQYCNFQVVLKGHGEYFGFRLDGNRRFLLGDFEVVKNTGKSTLIQDILAHKAHIIPVSQVYSGTEESNHFYSEKMPPITIYNKLDMECVRKFEERQKLAVKYLKNPWAVQIIDDCTDNPRLLRDPLIQGYYKNGRHWKMLHILSLQYSMDVLPAIRANIDYTFILRESGRRMRENLWKNYASCIDNFTDFCDIMDQITNDYTALVINNRSQSNKLEDCVFYYKAYPERIPVNWKFGAGSFWQYNHDRIDRNFIESFV